MCFHFQCFSKNMGDNNNTDFHDAAEEAEEAISLCELHLDVEDNTNTNNLEEIKTSGSQILSQSNQRSLSSSSSSSSSHDDQFFEFLCNLSSDMCPAEDIIFCGKLIPSNPQPLACTPLQQAQNLSNEDDEQGASHRRSESFSNLLQSYETRSNSTKNNQFLRISRSLDYQRLHRFGNSKTSTDLDMQRSASVRSAGKAENRKAASKPKWYFPLFGIVKFPPQMDMRDIKSRQFRRNPSHTEGTFPGNRSTSKISSSSSSWRFIKALSCSDHASVAVTASFCFSHA